MPNESILPHGKFLWALLMTEDEMGLTALKKMDCHVDSLNARAIKVSYSEKVLNLKAKDVYQLICIFQLSPMFTT